MPVTLAGMTLHMCLAESTSAKSLLLPLEKYMTSPVLLICPAQGRPAHE